MSTETNPVPDSRLGYVSKFMRGCLHGPLPEDVAPLDANRMTLAYFCVSGLDLLGVLQQKYDQTARARMCDWIYAQQCDSGFRAGPWLGIRKDISTNPHPYDRANLAMTYCALALLEILEDDFSRVNRAGILQCVKNAQKADGSVEGYGPASEDDVRYLYCACAICAILEDFSPLNVDAASAFIARCQNYDGAFGQRPQLESHGGSTYCCVASLSLMGTMESVLGDAGSELRERLALWLLRRQSATGGFQGRPHKDPDTCYAFWIGASLQMLGMFYDFVDQPSLRNFIWSTFGSMGGLAKTSENSEDVLHSYFGLCGLAECGEPGVKVFHPALGYATRRSHAGRTAQSSVQSM